jgi:uncharacterized protein (DUF4415 family)
MDKEMKAFVDGLVESIHQAKRGEGKVHTAEAIKARGRPKAEVTKVPVKIRLDPDVLEALRASGPGWQTRVNELLREKVLG